MKQKTDTAADKENRDKIKRDTEWDRKLLKQFLPYSASLFNAKAKAMRL